MTRDTQSALRLVNGQGLIIWDDYTIRSSSVVRAVDESGADVVHLIATDFAIHGLGTGHPD